MRTASLKIAHPLLYMDERQGTDESTKAFDTATWHDAYDVGYRVNRYPLPALYDDYSNPTCWDCVLGYYAAFG